jgi:ferredoxin-thioredoxin reductase catalytic subunit
MNIKTGKDKIIICKDNSALVTVENPIYIENGTEHILSFKEINNGEILYENESFSCNVTVDYKSNGLFCLKHRLKNISLAKRKFQTVFRIMPQFEVEKYLIPCVNFNGNGFGNGNEPKGLEKDGEKWIFAYDRTSIPSCTLTENKDCFCALFVSDETTESLKSACSISKAEGSFCQEIYHPVIEAPKTYYLRDDYSDKYESFIELNSGESFDRTFYIMVGTPLWKNYGMSNVLDAAYGLFCDNSYIKVTDKAVVWNNSIAFAESLVTDYKGKKGFIIGFLPDGKGEFEYRKDNCFELAWCGQNILFSRMFIEDYIRNGNKDKLDTALKILDTRVKYCSAESGLPASQLKHFECMDTAITDTCNAGYGAYEFLRCYERLKKIGIDKPEYFKAAKAACDFFCKNYSDTFGFGKAWSLKGECLEKEGSIGAFVISPLVKIYSMTKDRTYLDIAEKAFKLYAERDLENFCFTAGALDTCCVDKETSVPFIISSVMLYEATGKEIYIEYAKKAAYYFTSWMFHYEPVYPESSDVSKYNIYLKGLTSVSVQHHHLDMYAALIVPYLKKLAEYTDDKRWSVRADMMWRAVLQFIGDGELKIHGVTRPIGSQNEAVFQCNWGFRNGEKGQLNDWLVAWPCALRLSVLAEEEF